MPVRQHASESDRLDWIGGSGIRQGRRIEPFAPNVGAGRAGLPRRAAPFTRMRYLSLAVNERRTGRVKSSGETASGPATIIGLPPSSVAWPEAAKVFVACEEPQSRSHWLIGFVDTVLRCVPDCGEQKSQPGEQAAEVVTGGGQHGVDGVALRMGEMVATHSVLGFEMADHWLDR